VREVHEALHKDCGYTTTLKQMQLMTEKGLLTRSERFRSHVYESAVPKESLRTKIAGDLLQRVFGGQVAGAYPMRWTRTSLSLCKRSITWVTISAEAPQAIQPLSTTHRRPVLRTDFTTVSISRGLSQIGSMTSAWTSTDSR
jgi:hypothetical protein